MKAKFLIFIRNDKCYNVTMLHFVCHFDAFLF